MSKPSFITDLIRHAGDYGFQKSNRFIVFINGPAPEVNTTQLGGAYNNLFNSYRAISRLQRLALTCIDAVIPGRLISTQDVRTYNLSTKMPNFETYTQQLSLTFMASTDMYERMYFKAWQDKVLNPVTHSPGFYDEYAKPFTITIMVLPDNVNSFNQLGNPAAIAANKTRSTIDPLPFDDDSLDTNGIYFIRCMECYPLEINDVYLSSQSSDFMRVGVTFAFKKWIDPVEQYYVSQRDNANTDIARSVLMQDPEYVFKDSPETPYADRGNVLNQRKIDLTEDRVGLSEQQIEPWQKFIKYARDAIRYTNPKELKQLIVDAGLKQLGSAFGVENVEAVAQAGQIIDVFRRNPDYSYEGLRSRVLEPISNIGNINPANTGFQNLLGL